MIRVRVLTLLFCAGTLAGCTTPAESGAAETSSTAQVTPTAVASSPPSVQPRVTPPANPTTVVTGTDAGALALAVSRELFEEAPVVVVAADELGSQVRAASAAAELGAPMLIWPEASVERAHDPHGRPGRDSDILDELERLGTETLLAFGDAPTSWPAQPADLAIVRAPADADDLAELLGHDAAGVRTVTAEEIVTVLAESASPGTELLELEGPSQQIGEPTGDAVGGTTAQPAGTPTADDPPALRDYAAPDPLESVQALVMSDHHESVAALATAMAAGVGVIVMTDPDPRATPEIIATLAESPPERVLALGEEFGDPARLAHRVDVAATGVELAGGGQVLFPGRRLVALYGHPHSDVLGALGEQPLAAVPERAREVAAEYESVSDVPVIPTFEIIATVATADAGQDGNYSMRTDIDVLRPWVDAARDEGFYVVLDLQPGRTDFRSQAEHYEELLIEPHVGLALDPEWRLGADQVHMRQIGSVHADEVNEVVEWLATLTRKHALPQKLLILHQFKSTMLPHRERIDMSRDELAVVIHMDGNGPPGLKLDTWQVLTADPPPSAWWGWKNFYDEDDPMPTPEETMGVDPEPVYISYQ